VTLENLLILHRELDDTRFVRTIGCFVHHHGWLYSCCSQAEIREADLRIVVSSLIDDVEARSHMESQI
jgi:hypothetical protein